ncbi:MAG: hypothetical protein WC942_08610 [Clostridia bacterium]|jgi:hypothetical protein
MKPKQIIKLGFLQIGVCLDDLGASQLAYTVLTELQRHTCVGIDTIIFYNDAIRPCVLSNVAQFNISYLRAFDGVVLVTSGKTLMTATNNMNDLYDTTKMIFYLNNIHDIVPEVLDYVHRKQILCIARTEEYKQLAFALYPNLKFYDHTMLDFDMSTMKELVINEGYRTKAQIA